MTALCRALLRDRAEAEDATQQVFLSAHRALLNGSNPREPAAWLAAIARNECWARIRMRMREPLPSADVEAPAWLPDPLAEAIRRADLAALWRAIEELPPQQRQALLLREFAGLSYGELAAALAVSTPAVESLLFRARHGLRTRLRTAYATVSGASWIGALVRGFAGGAGAATPVAAKIAVLGVGAAAISGGAVVLPPRSHAVRLHPVAHARPHPTVAAVAERARVRLEAPSVPVAVSREDGSSGAGGRETGAADGRGDSGSSQPDGDASTQPTLAATVTTTDGGRDGSSGGGDGLSGTNSGE